MCSHTRSSQRSSFKKGVANEQNGELRWPISSSAKLLAAVLRRPGVISTFWDRFVRTFTCDSLQAQSGRSVQMRTEVSK